MASAGPSSFCFEVTAAAITRLGIVGSAPELGGWDLSKLLQLSAQESTDGDDTGATLWRSPALQLPPERFPLRFRFVANGHRSSPNTRPLVWDQNSRVIASPPTDGSVRFEFEPTADNSSAGWVTSAGVGAFQLRVGQPPGSTEPLVALEPALQAQQYRVDLFEAHPTDPTAPYGKIFARLSCAELGVLDGDRHSGATHEDDHVTYLLNSQSVEALAFRIDVTAVATGQLLARGFVTHLTLQQREGTVNVALLTPQLQQAGIFRASFLVIGETPHPRNNLGNLQRKRWLPNEPMLDIGHRGSGASKVQGHSVRENTLLSMQKAAVNHGDFIEFDVHVCADGEVVVHHDFEVKLKLGQEIVKLAIPGLTFQQLQSPDFTRYLQQPSEDPKNSVLDGEKARRKGTLQRNLSSAEDMLRSVFKPVFGQIGSPPLMGPTPSAPRWFLADKIAALREAFQRTPAWLGFNIELKYPTVAEVAAMRASFYSRNHFVDAVLKVVLDEARGRKVIFSTFDPDCATLLSLKQPRYPVFFLTCGGTKQFTDPRMNSLEAALQFALSSHLQGVVAEATSILGPQIKDLVTEFHRHGIFLFTWGDVNNDLTHYLAQKEAGVDAVIMDDLAKIAKALKKEASFFNKPLQPPASIEELIKHGSLEEESLAKSTSMMMLSSSPIIIAAKPVDGPGN